jgi:hypothetical protein
MSERSRESSHFGDWRFRSKNLIGLALVKRPPLSERESLTT